MGCIGSCLGSCLGSCACSLASCVCMKACSGCSSLAGKSSIFGRLMYAFLLLFAAALSLILRNLPQWLNNTTYFSWIPGFHGCNLQNNTTFWQQFIESKFGVPLSINVPEQLCYGAMSVYRVGFAYALFHLIMTFVMIKVKYTSEARAQFQHSWWSIKIVVLLILIIIAFFIPNVVFIGFAWIALIGSAFFVLIQLILLVDFAHSWNESWVSKYEDSQSKIWAVLLIGSTIVLYLASLVLTIIMYVFFMENQKECWMNPMFITINLIACIILTIFSIHPKIQEKNPRIGILQAGVVTIYMTYLCWSSISSEPGSMNCTKLSFGKNPRADGFSMAFGIILTFVSLIYAALRMSSQHEALLSKKDERAEYTKAATPKSETTEEHEDETELEDPIDVVPEDEEVDYNYSFFHFTFFLSSLYLVMVFTNWELMGVPSAPGVPPNTLFVDQGLAAVWIKIASSWLTSLIFLWTIIAPILFPVTNSIFSLLSLLE